MPRDDTHLLDILKAARLAIEFKGSAEKVGFLEDAKTQSAVLHQLLIIGEAVKRLSPDGQMSVARSDIYGGAIIPFVPFTGSHQS